MTPMISGWMIVPMLLYLTVILFLLWLAYRFVRAHERLADSTYRIARDMEGRDDGGG